MAMEATSRLIYELTHDLVFCWRYGVLGRSDHMHGVDLFL